MKKLIIACCSLLLSFATQAQIVVTPDVNDAIQAALSNDVTLKNNRLELEKEKLERKGVLNKYIPTVSTQAIYGYLDNKLTIDFPATTLPYINQQIFQDEKAMNINGNIFHGGATAKAVLFSGGQILNGAKALKYNEEGNALMMQKDEDALIKAVLESFDQLALLKAAEDLLDQSAARLEKEKLRVSKAVQNGLAIPYDRDKIELANLELQSKQKDIEHKKQLILLKLAHDTGLPVDTLARMQHSLEPIILTDEMDIENRVELQALEKYKLANKFLLKKEYGSYLPNVGAFASYSYSSLFNTHLNTYINVLNRDVDLKMNSATLAPNFMVGVALKWDIFNGFERNHNVHKAKLTAEQLDNKIADTRSLLELQLKKNRSDYDNQTDQLKIAQQKAKIATNNLTSAEKQYKEGLISVTERLAAETDVYQQRLALVESIMNQRKAAIETYRSSATLKTLITVK